MQKISASLTGTGLSQRGSETPLTGDRSGRGQSAVAIRSTEQDLPSTSAERDPDIRRAIEGPVAAMTGMQHMPVETRRAAFQFWVEALRPYPVEWITDAFAYFARNGEGQYPNPQRIIAIINKRRGGK